MKKTLVAVVMIGLMITGMSTAAMAFVMPGELLPVGGTINPTGDSYYGYGTLSPIATTGVISFSNAYYSGNVKEDVYLNTIGMLFVYNLNIKSSSVDAVSQMTTTDFDGWTLYADAFGTGDTPHKIKRLSGGGTVRWTFADTSIEPEDEGIKSTSATMWIQTNAQNYRAGGITLQNGHTENLNGFQPNAVPEPASAMLLGMGLIGYAGRAIRRKFMA